MSQPYCKISTVASVLALTLLVSSSNFSPVAATDPQPQVHEEPATNADRLLRHNTQATLLRLHRGYTSCISDTELQADLKELNGKIAKVGIQDKLIAAESLLRSGDKEDIAAGIGLLRDVNDSLKGRRIQLLGDSADEHK